MKNRRTNKWLSIIIFTSALFDLFSFMQINQSITLSNVIHVAVKNLVLLLSMIFLEKIIQALKK